MTDMTEPAVGKEFQELADHAPDTRVAPAQGIAAIALSMAMKYHDIATVQDGALYQQYKLEGRNLVPLQLDMVFETAILMEAHLLGASNRIADLLIKALEVMPEPDEPAPTEPAPEPTEEPAPEEHEPDDQPR